MFTSVCLKYIFGSVQIPDPCQIQVVDGASGSGLWAAEFVCPDLHLDGSSVTTTSGQSAFLFWAGDPLRVAKNITKTTVSPYDTPDEVDRDGSTTFCQMLVLVYPAP